MHSKIIDNLTGKEGNYIMPFFWQHGEPEDVLREYMKIINEANIGEVCVEARPHPEYGKDGWWKDMDIIIEEARKRNMGVWILDDAHFPTGSAGGIMESAPVDLQKQYLFYHSTDVSGPKPQITLDVKALAKYIDNPMKNDFSPWSTASKTYEDDTLVTVIAAKMNGNIDNAGNHLEAAVINLTPYIEEGILEWDVPGGMWRVFIIFRTRNGGGASDYINLVSHASCEMQIKGVYEPHYDRYKDEFGKTIRGFFSDEPALGNTMNFNNDNKIGKYDMQLPWSEALEEDLKRCWGADYEKNLPALWFPMGEESFYSQVRVDYMNCVTRRVQKDFSEQLGDWCRIHGVEYIGHIVEDNNVNTRMGNSIGHFFRALWGQDMSGIDDIGGQILDGGANKSNLDVMGEKDGEFFHNVLGKLGASLGHLDPKKKGRTMCELFGAYGWGLGTRMMKYQADHFLVRGINRYVPHAFSPKEFPDPDCPPHFYAHGENPLYRPFGKLMQYMNRVSHLIDGGIHKASVALLYHAEADWSGQDFMLMQKPARVLLENQIDFDIVPTDIFTDCDSYQLIFDGKLHVNQETFEALVVPGISSYITQALADFIQKAKEANFPVIFIDLVPEQVKQLAVVVSLDQLAAALHKMGIYDVKLSSAFPELRFYHYEQQDEIYYMFSNESVDKTFCGNITFTTVDGSSAMVKAAVFQYDAMDNHLHHIESKKIENRISLELCLTPYESTILVFAKNKDAYQMWSEKEVFSFTDRTADKVFHEFMIASPWQVSFTENKEYPVFAETCQMNKLVNIHKVKQGFSGIIRYENSFFLPKAGKSWLYIEDAYESVEVWINEQLVNMKICPPFRFDISGYVKSGDNILRIETATTLEGKNRQLSGGKGIFGPDRNVVNPCGIIGNVKILLFYA